MLQYVYDIGGAGGFNCIIVQIGHGVGGNFNIHIWACSGGFIVGNR